MAALAILVSERSEETAACGMMDGTVLVYCTCGCGCTARRVGKRTTELHSRRDCDDACNNPANDYDGGDCSRSAMCFLRRRVQLAAEHPADADHRHGSVPLLQRSGTLMARQASVQGQLSGAGTIVSLQA